MEEILILRTELIHHSDLDETNAKHSQYHIANEIHWALGDRSDF